MRSERKIIEVVASDIASNAPVVSVERRRQNDGKNAVVLRILGDYGNAADRGVPLSDNEATEVMEALQAVLA
jgi:hypothetical protein